MRLHNSSSEKRTYFKTRWVAWFASWGKAGQSCQEGGCRFFIWVGLEKTHWWEATIGSKEECVKSLAEDLLQPSVPKEKGLSVFARLGEPRWQKMLRRWKRKRSREIFSVLFGSYILQQKPPFSAHGRSQQHTEIKPVLPKRQCIYHSFIAGYTHVHPHVSQVTAGRSNCLFTGKLDSQLQVLPTAGFHTDLKSLQLQLNAGTMQWLVKHKREWKNDWLNTSSLCDVRPGWTHDKVTQWIRYKRTQISPAAWKSTHPLACGENVP